MSGETEEYEMKFCTLGDASVGKTNILLRYFEDRFDVAGQPTIGFDHMSKEIAVNIEVRTGDQVEVARENILLKIFDTAGQERFQTFTNVIFQGTTGFILVYDVTSRKSFESIEKWLKLIVERSEVSAPRILLLANKIDLDSKRTVSVEEGRTLAAKHGMLFVEVSALENKSNCIGAAIENLIQTVAQDLKEDLLRAFPPKAPVKDLARVDEGQRAPSKNCC